MNNPKKLRSVKIFALLLIAAAMLSFMTTAAFAESSQTPQTSEEPAGEFKTEREDQGFFNTIIFWRENGGVVTDVFGEKTPGVRSDGKAVTGLSIPWAQYWMTFLLMAIVSYVVGSINFGVLVSKGLYKEDVRGHGSGNAGSTNVLRVYGKKAALLTLLGDMLKCSFCAFCGSLLAGNGCGYVAMLFCMIGHAFPVFFKFKGGKGVAAALGGMLVLEPIAALLSLIVFIIIVAWTKYVSLGSILAATLLPLFVNVVWQVRFVHNPTGFDYFIVITCTVLYACFIVWLHRANMKRLMSGTENKTYLFKKKEKAPEKEK